MWKLFIAMSLACGMLSVAVADTPSAKSNVSVEFCGRLRHGVVAIGGECTGTNISFNRIIWELQLHNDADRKFAEQHHKKTVVVTGSLRKVSGIETKDRWIIDVKKLSEQDVTKNKAGIRIAIAGQLQHADPVDGKAASMTIRSACQTWPINLSDAKLKSTAESLVDQPVLLMGTLKSATESASKAQPTIYVSTLKRSPRAPIKQQAK